MMEKDEVDNGWCLVHPNESSKTEESIDAVIENSKVQTECCKGHPSTSSATEIHVQRPAKCNLFDVYSSIYSDTEYFKGHPSTTSAAEIHTQGPAKCDNFEVDSIFSNNTGLFPFDDGGILDILEQVPAVTEVPVEDGVRAASTTESCARSPNSGSDPLVDAESYLNNTGELTLSNMGFMANALTEHILYRIRCHLKTLCRMLNEKNRDPTYTTRRFRAREQMLKRNGLAASVVPFIVSHMIVLFLALYFIISNPAHNNRVYSPIESLEEIHGLIGECIENQRESAVEANDVVQLHASLCLDKQGKYRTAFQALLQDSVITLLASAQPNFSHKADVPDDTKERIARLDINFIIQQLSFLNLIPSVSYSSTKSKCLMVPQGEDLCSYLQEGVNNLTALNKELGDVIQSLPNATKEVIYKIVKQPLDADPANDQFLMLNLAREVYNLQVQLKYLRVSHETMIHFYYIGLYTVFVAFITVVIFLSTKPHCR